MKIFQHHEVCWNDRASEKSKWRYYFYYWRELWDRSRNISRYSSWNHQNLWLCYAAFSGAPRTPGTDISIWADNKGKRISSSIKDSMKTSILIIAHNEETHIQECIESILNQSKQASEIILIAHNCTDNTANIAKKYSQVTLYEYLSDETGPIPAREYGFEKAHWDVIACLDGDSYVVPTWLEEITQPLNTPHVNSVSGYPILLGSYWASYIFFLQWLPPLRHIFPFYFWWGNFACRKEDYDISGGIKKCREIGKSLWLYYPAEDCILSFLLQKRGKLAFARKARSYVYPGVFFDEENRNAKQREDLKKIKKYFNR